MTSKPPTSHKPARWRAKAAVFATAATAALGLATIPGLASAAPATAILSGPTVHEQQNLSANITIATNNVHTIATTSPVLAAHNYLVNLVIDLASIPPGANVLCGASTTLPGDIVTGDYGALYNQGTNTTTDGTCDFTGTIQINNPNDHVIAWATVYSGPGGAIVSGFSMNELPVGTVVITH